MTNNELPAASDLMAPGEDTSVLITRLYRLLDRLLRHLDLLAGEQRDTWWFRHRLEEGHTFEKANSILDQLEAFLVHADSDLAQNRDAELRTLTYSQNQCEELMVQAAYSAEQLERLLMLLGDAEYPVEVLSDDETEVLRELLRDMKRTEDRLRLLERKLNELHSGVRSRVDIGFKDVVTGVYKAEGFFVRCAELHARWQRAGSPLAAVVFSITGEGNAPVSPLTRDELMRMCALEVESRIRVSDVLARTGENEFVLLLPDTSLDGATTFTNRMISALEAAGFKQYGDKIQVAVSAGLTEVRSGDDAMSFVSRARAACAESAAGQKTAVVH